jgi:hypothetical protein
MEPKGWPSAGRTHLWSVGKKSRVTEQGNPFHQAAGKQSMDPLAVSEGLQMRVKPGGNLGVKFHMLALG